MPSYGSPFVFFLSLPLLAISVQAGEAPADPWAKARNLDFAAAAQGVSRLQAAAPDDARLIVAQAAALLARQPRTEGNILEARALFSQIAAGPGSDSDPEPRIIAAYLVARIDQDHLETPRIDSARAGYEALRIAHPGHPLADQAALQLGYILAYQTPGLATVAAIAPIEALLASVHTVNARRELHLLLARLQERTLHDDAAALSHLQAARALGCQSLNRDSELDLMIGTLAARLGRGELAARHYRAFADARPLEIRAATARRLADEALASAASKP